jgi:WD40 repeat protein
MAFAVHRLWEERDRERRLLTEAAYERIGGVAGALARHADATLERIGSDRLPIVRELFRNLVTAEGTRAVREWDELLSIFRDSHSESRAEEVLRQLIDARLLTSYEIREADGAPTRRVEIIHESLLTSWPRLVRWQTQDADGARLRDELRQAARLWDDHERSSDYLWTGTAFREFSVWREHYPGGLSELEEGFASAMTSLATRRRRTRRAALAATISLLLAVLAVVGTLWRRSVQEARRAEAAKLLALGQLRLEDYPTATLAHAIASLELADTPEARRLALRALWEGPTAFVVNEDQTRDVEFAARGDVLVQAMQGSVEHHLRVVTRDGSSRLLEHAHDCELVNIGLNPEGTMMFSESMVPRDSPQHLAFWSLPEGAKIGDARFPPGGVLLFGSASWRPGGLLIGVHEGDHGVVYDINLDGTSERLASVADLDANAMACDLLGRQWLALAEDDVVSVYRFIDGGLSEPRHLRRSGHTVRSIAFDAEGRFLATAYVDGQIRLWDPESAAVVESFAGLPGVIRIRVLDDPLRVVADSWDGEVLTTRIWSVGDDGVRLLRTIESVHMGSYPGWDVLDWTWDRGRRLLAKSGPDNVTRVWSLNGPADADPTVLKRGDVGLSFNHAFSPGSDWLATGDGSGLALWPLGRQYPSIIRVHQQPVWSMAFGPRGAWLASGDFAGAVNLTPLEGDVPPPGHAVYQGEYLVSSLAVTSDGARLLATSQLTAAATVIPLDGGPPSSLRGLHYGYGGAFSPDGRLAVVAGVGRDSVRRLYLVRADTAEPVASFELADGIQQEGVAFEDDGRILSCGPSGVFRTDPSTGGSELLFDGICGRFAASSDGRRIALVESNVALSLATSGRVVVIDLETGTKRSLESHGDEVWSVAMDATGAMVATGDREGVLRVGPANGDEPYLLLGHEGRIRDVEFDPLGRWIATGGEDGTVRIWPMPDLSKPPLHTLPREELIAKLKTLTNLRVVRDEDSPTGWTLTHDPFPGWETVPTW